MPRGRSLFTPEPRYDCSRCGAHHRQPEGLAYQLCYSGLCPVVAGHTPLPAQPNTGTSSFAPNASAATAVTPRRPRPGPQPVYTLSSHGFYRVRGNPDGSSRNPGNARRGYFKCGYCEVRRTRIEGIKDHLLEAHPEEYDRLRANREYQADRAR